MQRGMQINDTQARQNREHHHQRRRDVWKAQPDRRRYPSKSVGYSGFSSKVRLSVTITFRDPRGLTMD